MLVLKIIPRKKSKAISRNKFLTKLLSMIKKLKKIDEKLDDNTQKKLKILDIDLKFKKPFKVNKSSDELSIIVFKDLSELL